MVVSNRQRGGNFKGSKHQRSKPKKQETPKQEGGWLDWLVPPLAIARIAREKKAKRRREMMRRKRMERMNARSTNPDYVSANNNYRYARPRQQGGSWWPSWIAPKPTNIIRGYNKGGRAPPANYAGKRKIRAGKRNYTQMRQKGGIVADERKLARQAQRHNLMYYKLMKK
jgi:hypothetical protein